MPKMLDTFPEKRRLDSHISALFNIFQSCTIITLRVSKSHIYVYLMSLEVNGIYYEDFVPVITRNPTPSIFY